MIPTCHNFNYWSSYFEFSKNTSPTSLDCVSLFNLSLMASPWILKSDLTTRTLSLDFGFI